MTGHEFDNLMNVVFSRWTKKAYPDPVVQRIWFFVKDLPARSFEKIIYTLLDTQRAAPMPNEFRMLAYGEFDRLGIRRNKEPESKPSREAKCWDCADSGNLYATHKQKNTTAVFRCHCPAGHARPASQGAIWNSAWAEIFSVDSIYPDIKGDWRPREGMRLVSTVRDMMSIQRESKRGVKSASEILNPDPDGAA